MTDVRSVAVRLDAQVAGYVANMRYAGKVTRDSFNEGTKLAANNKQAIHEVGNAAGKMGLAAAAGVGIAVKRFADFDSEMSEVRAASQATGKELDDLRGLALKLGADSQFSAAEAAQGITELSKAGVSNADIMSGALKGSLDLAAAGQIAVGDAAEFTATALTQFQLAGNQATHVADLLAAGAGKAQGEVTDMALALDYVGVPAANLGVTIEQTAGTIALLAKNGIVGQKAGTGLRGMLASLTSPSAVAAKTMAALNIEVFDAKGNFIGLDGVAGQLRRRMKNLTDEERANYLGKIFGNEQLQAANVLYREGAEGVRGMTNEINIQGFAADQAAQKTDNLKGDIERLGGALDSLLIGSAEGADGPLRGLVQNLTGLVDVVNEVPDPLKTAAFYGLGLVAAVGGLTWAGTRAITAVGGMRNNIATLRAEAAKTIPYVQNLDRATAFRGALRGAGLIAGLTIAQSGLAEKSGLSNTASLALMGTIAGPWGAAIGGGIGLVKDLASANNDLEAAIKGANKAAEDPINFAAQEAAIKALGAAINENVSMDTSSLSGILDSSVKGLASLFSDSAEDAIDKQHELRTALMATKQGLAELYASANHGDMSLFGGTEQEISRFANTVVPALEAAGLDVKKVLLNRQDWDVATEAVRSYVATQDSLPARTDRTADAVAGMGDEMQTAAEKAKSLSDALTALLDPAMDQDKAQVAMQRSLRTLTEDLKGGADALNIYTKQGQDNRDSIRDRVEALKAVLVADANAGASGERMAKKLKRVRQEIIDGAVAAGVKKTAVEDLLKQYELTPAMVKTIIEAVGTDKAKNDIEDVQSAAEQLGRTQVSTKVEVDAGRAFAMIDGVRVALRNLDGTVSNTYIRTTRTTHTDSRLGPARADGGAIGGVSPHPRADNILTPMTAGEHVWSVAEVQGAGGHARVERLRRLARSGQLEVRGYADGGEFRAARAVPRFTAAAAARTAPHEGQGGVFPRQVQLVVGGRAFDAYIQEVAGDEFASRDSYGGTTGRRPR